MGTDYNSIRNGRGYRRPRIWNPQDHVWERVGQKQYFNAQSSPRMESGDKLDNASIMNTGSRFCLFSSILYMSRDFVIIMYAMPSILYLFPPLLFFCIAFCLSTPPLLPPVSPPIYFTNSSMFC